MKNKFVYPSVSLKQFIGLEARSYSPSMAEAAQLDAFLAAMTHYSPAIPDELVEFYLQQTGFVTNDVRITRLIALVAYKLLQDVTHDAMQYQRIRVQALLSSAATGAALAAAVQTPDGTFSTGSRAVLTMEDLAASLKEYGVNICRPEYVSDVADNDSIA